jgi:uncharacterized Zn-finger protein
MNNFEKIKYFQCNYCKKIFTPIEVQYSKLNILEECPYCHGSYKIRAVYKESEVRE